MKNIMIIGSIPGSIINFRQDLIIKWLKLGYNVTAVTAPAENDIEAKINEIGVKFRSIPLERDGLNPIADVKTLRCLLHIIKDEKPEMIFAYTIKPVVFSGLCLYFNSGIKYFPMITGLGYAFSGTTLLHRIVRSALILLYKIALRKGDTVFFQNRDDRDLFQKYKLVSGLQKSVLINGSGVNIDYYNFSEINNDKMISFLLIARLLYSKGIKEYAEAAAILKSNYCDVSFKLLGPLSAGPDGVAVSELKEWQADGIIDYLGRKEDVRPYIKECSVYALPSSYREGVPRSILEAMSMGRPVITTDAPGCRETVEDGVNGFLVPVKDAKALAKAMERFILEPELIPKMGVASRKLAEEKFDVNKVNKVIIEAMGL